jgi:hypothetical protein
VQEMKANKQPLLFILLSQIITSYAQVDVTTYGAIANDGLDDLPAINLALSNTVSGDSLYFPAGTFDLAGKLYINDNISLNGAGQILTTLKYMNSGATGLDFIVFENVEDVTISHFAIDNNNSAEITTSFGVYSTTGGGNHISNITVKNIQVEDGKGVLLIQNPGLPVTTLRNCHFTSIRGHFSTGILMYHGKFDIKHNTLNNIGGNGIVGINFSGKVADNAIHTTGNDFINGNASGFMSIELHPDNTNPGPYDLIIENNEMDSWMSVVGGHDIAIRNNQLIGDGWIELGFVKGIISGNTVNNATAANPDRAISGISLQTPCKNLLISDNTILNTRMSGIGVNGHAGTWPSDHIEKIYFKSNRIENTQNEFNFGGTNPGTAFSIIAYAYKLDFDQNLIKNNKAEGFSLVRYENANYLPDEFSFINNTIEDNVGVAFLDGNTTYGGENVFSSTNIVSGNGTDNSFSNKGFLANQKPDITLGTPTLSNGVYSFPYEFTDDGTLTEILWDFGEGLANMNFSPTHVFSNQQTYKISVVAWDNEGRATFDSVILDLSLNSDVIFVNGFE